MMTVLETGFPADGFPLTALDYLEKSAANRRKTDDLYRVLVEAMNEGLGILDDYRRMTYVNPAFCRITGYEPGELLGIPLDRAGLFDDDSRDVLLQHLEEHDRGQFLPYKLRLLHKSGDRRIVRISPRPLRDRFGHLQGSFAILTDITDSALSEEKILMLSAAIEQSPIGVMITDKTGRIEYVNPRFEQISHHSKSDLLGATPRVIQGPDNDNSIYEDLWRTISRGQSWQGELQDQKKNGEVYWAKNTIFGIKDHQGDTSRYVAYHDDVTERKLADQRLKESEAKYSLLVERSLTGIYIIQDGRIAYANQRFATTLGYALEELLERDVFELIHPEDWQRHAELGASALTEKNDVEGHVVRWLTKTGKTLTFKQSCTPIPYQGRLAILGNAMDITFEKELEQQLLNSAKQLEALSQQLITMLEGERKRVASDLHDGVGQYLHAIKFGLERLRHAPAPKDGESSSAQSGYAKLAPVVTEAIEEVRRISTDLRPPILDDLGIIATIGWFCRRFGSIYSDIEIEKSIEIAEHEVPEPLKIGIFRVLQETMSNVGKHSGATRLKVAMTRSGDELVLAISDNGKGFDAAEILVKERSNSGFGLVGMRERVRLSGGRFHINSAPGRGTETQASWPLTD